MFAPYLVQMVYSKVRLGDSSRKVAKWRPIGTRQNSCWRSCLLLAPSPSAWTCENSNIRDK